jgi:hypothetical protein
LIIDRFEDDVKPTSRVEVSLEPKTQQIYVQANDIPTPEHPDIECVVLAFNRDGAIRLREALDAAIYKLETGG